MDILLAILLVLVLALAFWFLVTIAPVIYNMTRLAMKLVLYGRAREIPKTFREVFAIVKRNRALEKSGKHSY